MKFEELRYKNGDIRIRKKFCWLPYTYTTETKYITYWLQNIWIEEKRYLPSWYDDFEPYWSLVKVYEHKV